MTLKSMVALASILLLPAPALVEPPPTVSAVMLGGRATAAVLRMSGGEMRIVRPGDIITGGVVSIIDPSGLRLADGRRLRLEYVRVAAIAPSVARAGKSPHIDINVHFDAKPDAAPRTSATSSTTQGVGDDEESARRARANVAATAVFAAYARPVFTPRCERPSPAELSFPAVPPQSPTLAETKRSTPSPCE